MPPAKSGILAQFRHDGSAVAGKEINEGKARVVRISVDVMGGDFGPKVGTLRLDYVLPSTGLGLIDSGVFWPTRTDPASALADASDHHLVWVDVTIEP